MSIMTETKTHVQALIFRKDHFTAKAARAWLKKHHYRAMKRVHETPNYFRYRIKEPIDRGRYRLIEFTPGIKAVMFFPHPP